MILEKTLESTLDDYFDIIPNQLFEEAQEKAFEELDYEECTEDQCIVMIQEMLQVENSFQLVVISEEDDTQISVTWNDLDKKRVEEKYCGGCKTNELREIIAGLVEKLVLGKQKILKKEDKESKNDSKYLKKADISEIWIKQFGSKFSESINNIKLDSKNNIFLVGSTYGQIDKYINHGESDIILAKYSPTGEKLWITNLGTPKQDVGYGLYLDIKDNIYITGYTSQSLEQNNHKGRQDLFLAKYNNNGKKIWVKQYGTSRSDIGYSLTIDTTMNIYITGTYGAGSWGHFLLMKLNPNGKEEWIREIDCKEICSGRSVTLDSKNNIYVTGYTKGELGNTNVAGNCNGGSCSDILLIKYNSYGVKQWSKQIGSLGNDKGSDLIIDSDNYIYLTGYTEGKLDGNVHIGGKDIFLMKYNLNGEKEWSKQFGTKLNDSANSIALDSFNNIYLTGTTEGRLDINNNKGKDDIFLIKYNTYGENIWVKQIGTDNFDEGNVVGIDSLNDIIISGITRGSFSEKSNYGKNDAFLIKYKNKLN